MENECIGCSTYSESHSTCINRFDPNISPSGCPCRVCLIKGICFNECEEYLIYWELE